MKETGTLWNLNKLHRELSRKLFISWECLVTKWLSSSRLPTSRITMPGGSEPAGQKREGNGFAIEGQGQGCSSCCSGHALLSLSPGTLNTGNIQLSLRPGLTKSSWATAPCNWRDDVVGIRSKEKKKWKTQPEIKMVKIRRLSCVLIN